MRPTRSQPTRCRPASSGRARPPTRRDDDRADEADPPRCDQAEASPRRRPRAARRREGWFNHAIGPSASPEPTPRPVSPHARDTSYDGTRQARARRSTGTCRDAAGNVSDPPRSRSSTTPPPPQVAGLTPDAPPDAHGYFRAPSRSPSQGTTRRPGSRLRHRHLRGPDGAARAGHAARAATSRATPPRARCPSPFDATAPSLAKRPARSAGDSCATLSWRARRTQAVRVVRRPGPAQARNEGAALASRTPRLRTGALHATG